MILDHVVGILSHPDREWEKIRDEPNSISHHYFSHTMLLALIPALAMYFGFTQVGWSIGSSEKTYFLTSTSAMQLAVMSYGAMIVAVFILGKFVDYMHETYWGDDHRAHGIAVASYVSVPMFMAGVFMAYPILWLDILVAMAAVGYSVYLLYEGIPIIMRIDKDKGFLFASTVITIGLVMLVSMMAATIVIWSFGFGPQMIST